MTNQEIPNCAICAWHFIEYYAVLGKRDYCAAQGNIDLKEAYNNKMCQKLYVNKNKERIIDRD